MRQEGIRGRIDASIFRSLGSKDRFSGLRLCGEGSSRCVTSTRARLPSATFLSQLARNRNWHEDRSHAPTFSGAAREAYRLAGGPQGMRVELAGGRTRPWRTGAHHPVGRRIRHRLAIPSSPAPGRSSSRSTLARVLWGVCKLDNGCLEPFPSSRSDSRHAYDAAVAEHGFCSPHLSTVRKGRVSARRPWMNWPTSAAKERSRLKSARNYRADLGVRYWRAGAVPPDAPTNLGNRRPPPPPLHPPLPPPP
jgi:hypothetical protein